MNTRVVCVVLVMVLAVAAAQPSVHSGHGGPPQQRGDGVHGGHHGGRGVGGVREACQADVEHLCQAAMSDGPGAVFQCLAGNMDKITDECKRAIGGSLMHSGDDGDHHDRQPREDDGGRPEGHGHGRDEGGRNRPNEHHKGKHHGGKRHGGKHHGGKRHGRPGGKLVRACKSDVKTLCKDAMSAGPLSVLKCLSAKKAELSPKCSTALDSMPKPPADVVKVLESCSKQMESVCPKPSGPPGDGPARRLRGERHHDGRGHHGDDHRHPPPPPGPEGLMRCLVHNVDKLTGQCAVAVKALAPPPHHGGDDRHHVAHGGDNGPDDASLPVVPAGDLPLDGGMPVVKLDIDWAMEDEDEEDGDAYVDEDDEDDEDEDDERTSMYKGGHSRHGHGHGHGRRFPWHIVGIAAGGVALVALIIAAVVIIRRRRARRAQGAGFTQLSTVDTSVTVQGTPVAFA